MGVSEANGIASYFLDFSEKANYQGPFDANGIPLTPYGGTVGLRHYPIDIAQYGLGLHQRLSGEKGGGLEPAFLAQAEWLVHQLTPLEFDGTACGLWYSDFDWHHVKAPWPSAMAQGQGISVLTRAYGLTGDERYLESASVAGHAMRIPVEAGGVTRFDADGAAFFEELPAPSPSRILNGAIFAYWGLVDLLSLRPDAKLQGLADNGRTAILKYLPRYDLGFWTRYSLEERRIPTVSSVFYQRLHVNQMTAMHKLTALPAFLEYSLKWREQLDSRISRACALPLKVIGRLAS
jgi:heparosan-N-sulfate-glucuronate 5-epimerase